jgi:hypothetical protein
LWHFLLLIAERDHEFLLTEQNFLIVSGSLRSKAAKVSRAR